MNIEAPFTASDLEELDARLYSQAERVVPMRDVFKGDTAANVIGLRHDVDDNEGSLETAFAMAEWEFERGYSSTYFLLHGSHYWGEEMVCSAYRFEELGHEVGIHVNALAEALRHGGDPQRILARAVSELRGSGVRVTGCVAHGDALCHRAGFVNDEIFTESPRPECGLPDRYLRHGEQVVSISPISRAIYALDYDANWLSRGDYLSDSGGRWSQPVDGIHLGAKGQLHMLIHPDWWAEAFTRVSV